MNDQDRPANMPMVLVVLLALLGLSVLPQGQGGRGGRPASIAPETSGPAEGSGGHRSSAEAGGRGEDLGPLEPLREHWQGEDLSDSGRSVLRFLIVTVPDPDDTSISHEFDSTLAAVLRAVESEGYVAERYAFPWAPDAGVKPAASPSPAGDQPPGLTVTLRLGKSDNRGKPWPGSILCRRVDERVVERKGGEAKNKDGTEALLLLLLVPETPTWGVDKQRLGAAIQLVVKEHQKDKKACERIRIVGPLCSGSFTSLAGMVKQCWRELDNDLKFTIINGSALSPPSKTVGGLFGEEKKGSVELWSTVHPRGHLVDALVAYLKETAPLGGQPDRVALLVEAGSPFGLALPLDLSRPASGSAKPDLFAFPMGISRIRQEYTARGYYQPNEPLRLAAPERLSLQAMTGRTGDRDLMPVFSPGTAAVEGELVLAQILQELERGRYTTIGIIATSPYDRLFLAYKIRQVCPDARLTFTSSSSLYTHHDIVPYLRGSLVVSTYPLQLANQSWSPAPAVGKDPLVRMPRVGFPHYDSEGIYNATVANLAEMLGDDMPALLDYGVPGEVKAGGSVPPIWVSVVGERGLYPLAVRETTTVAETNVGALYRSPHPQTKPEVGDIMPRLDPSWVGVYLAIAGIATFGAAWYIQHRDLINSRAGRRLAPLAVSAALGQVILQGLPAWGFARVWAKPEDGRPPLSEMWLDERVLALAVGVLAGLVGMAASLVSLLRVVREHDLGPSHAHDRLSGTVVALAATLQVILPLAFVGLYLATFRVADLRLDCERISRLTNGVTPLVPLLLLGLADGFALFGGWCRIELHAHLGAVKVMPGAAVLPDSSAAFGPVRSDLQMIQKTLDAPLMVGTHANPWLLPALGLSVLAGISAVGRVPVSLEWWGLHWLILLAFAMTTLMIVLRLIELSGLWRLNARLLQAVAQLPMVRAFDRLPTRLTLSGRAASTPSLPAPSAAEVADPLIDRQFQALAAGYGRVRPTLDAHGISTSTDGDPIDEFLHRSHAAGAGRLLPAEWWQAVDALLPILVPFWARRSATTAYAAATGTGASPPDADAEWPGLDELTPIDRPVGDESGPDFDPVTAEGCAPAAVQALREPAVAQVRRPGPTARPEEVHRWLRDVEDFIALVLAPQLAWLRRYCSSIETSLVVGLLTLTLVVTSYPFQPRGQRC